LTIFVTYNIAPYLGSMIGLHVFKEYDAAETAKNALFRAMDTIRPLAVTLTDAFEYTDLELMSAIGSFEGDAYNNLFTCWRDARLNREPTKIYGQKTYLRPVAKL
jgi:hypothetical protein